MKQMCPRSGMPAAGVRLRLRAVRAVLAEERGSDLVEAALVIPLLMTFMVGVVSFGRAFNVYQTMTRAAREGARKLVLTSCATCGNAFYTASVVRTNFVDPSLTASNLNPGQVAGYSTTFVWQDPNGSPPQECGVAISFSYPYQFVIPFTSVNLSTITLSTRVQMRLENQPLSCPVGTAVP